MRKQPITLYDLITILRNAEKEDRRRQRESQVREVYPDSDFITSIAHEEWYHESIGEILELCQGCMGSRTEITLLEVATQLGRPVTQIYIPLLFLMQEGHLGLRQETFFGDLFIELGCNPAG